MMMMMNSLYIGLLLFLYQWLIQGHSSGATWWWARRGEVGATMRAYNGCLWQSPQPAPGAEPLVWSGGQRAMPLKLNTFCICTTWGADQVVPKSLLLQNKKNPSEVWGRCPLTPIGSAILPVVSTAIFHIYLSYSLWSFNWYTVLALAEILTATVPNA